MNKAPALYAAPREVHTPEECFFYHTIDLPGYGVIKGQWDLRNEFDVYMGNVSFQGKRVLEVGTANGFLCFEMEKRGAEVVAYDLSARDSWDLVPYAGIYSDEMASIHRGHIDRLNKAWWLGHNLTRSKARMVYGSVYAIPREIGPVQIATFGSILQHLRDPFLALQKAADLATETIIVTEAVPPTITEQACSRLPALNVLRNTWQVFSGHSAQHLIFRPDADKQAPGDTWWWLPPGLVIKYLKILGFGTTRLTYHRQRHELQKATMLRLYTVVGTKGK